MQHRYKTDLTADQYVSRSSWFDAPPPRCIKGLEQGCGIEGNGTYRRKYPDGTKIKRWRCRKCRRSFSALPDCYASHMRGTLDELEEQIAFVESQSSVMAAVRKLYSEHADPETPWRRLRYRMERVHRALRDMLNSTYHSNQEVVSNTPWCFFYLTQAPAYPRLSQCRSKIFRLIRTMANMRWSLSTAKVGR